MPEEPEAKHPPPPLHPAYMTVQNPETGEYFHLEPPPTDARDMALGKLVDAFSRLESQLFTTFALLFGISHQEVRETLYNVLDSQKLRDALASLGTLRLGEEAQKELGRLLTRAKDATTKRNRIIHGDWKCVFTVLAPTHPKAPYTVDWIREYQPTNPIERKELLSNEKNQKVRAKYQFTIKSLLKISADMDIISGGIGEFFDKFKSEFPPQPAKRP